MNTPSEDRFAITDLLYRYAELIDAGGFDGVGRQPIVVGRYSDRFARDADGWYFTQRIADFEMVGNVSEHLMFPLSANKHGGHLEC